MRLATLLMTSCLLAVPSVALAAGGGSNTSNTPSCPTGQAYDSQTQKCVDQQSEAITDDERTNYAFVLADNGRYEEALDLIASRTAEHDVLSLTARGYTIRKSGNVEGSLCYYMDAINMSASDTRPRQYLGEAYVQLGILDMAQEQLDAIEALVGTDHPHYVALAEMMAGAS